MIKPTLEELKLDIKIAGLSKVAFPVMTVHDSMVFEVRNDYMLLVGNLIKNTIIELKSKIEETKRNETIT